MSLLCGAPALVQREEGEFSLENGAWPEGVPLLLDEGAEAVVEVWRQIEDKYGMRFAASKVRAIVEGGSRAG